MATWDRPHSHRLLGGRANAGASSGVSSFGSHPHLQGERSSEWLGLRSSQCICILDLLSDHSVVCNKLSAALGLSTHSCVFIEHLLCTGSAPKASCSSSPHFLADLRTPSAALVAESVWRLEWALLYE